MILRCHHRSSQKRSENESKSDRERDRDGGAVLRPNEDEPANEQSDKSEGHCESRQFVGDPTSSEDGCDDGVEHGYEPEGGRYVVCAFFASLLLGVGVPREGE